jgi:hypothetical protein
MSRLWILFFVPLVFTSCLPVKTSEPEEAFMYWAGSPPADDLNVIYGSYYQSPHFTLEYEVFLKIEAPRKWLEAYTANNKLSLNQSKEFKRGLPEVPLWFKPDERFVMYSRKDDFDPSRYFIDSSRGVIYIYESVGM